MRAVVVRHFVLVSIAIGGVMGLSLLMNRGGGKAAKKDFVGDGAQALRQTEGSNPVSSKVDEGVTAFLGLFRNFEPDSVSESALQVYSKQAYFNDGFAELSGREAIADYLVRTAAATRALEVELEHRAITGGDVYLRWVMRFTTSGRRSRTIVTPGVSHLRFDEEGQVTYHRDYWDASGALAEFVPGMGAVLGTVRNRIESM